MTNSPSDKLVDPVVKEPKNVVDDLLHIPDFLNGSYWFAGLCEELFHIDPFKEVGKAFGGDWEKVQQAGQATKNIAAFNRAYAVTVRNEINKLTSGGLVQPQNGGTGSDTVPSDAKWVGHSAEAAHTYFTVFGNRLDQQASAMDSVGDAILQAADAVYAGAHLLETLLQSAFDKLFDLAVVAAAVAATIVVGPIGPLVAGLTVFKDAYQAIRDVMDQVGKIQALVDAATALIKEELLGNDANSLHLVPLAADHYYHQGVDHNVNL